MPPTHAGLPDLYTLRQAAYIQSQVDQRLRDLASNDNLGTKNKSLRGGGGGGGSVEVVVPNRVKWPQEFVLSRSKKERIQYDQLPIVQWVAGFCWILRNEKDPQVKEHKLDYLIALMEDVNDFFWDAAWASHAVLLCMMEQGEVKGYSETDKLDRIRRANVQRHVVTSPNEAQNSHKRSKLIRFSLASTSIRAHACIKNHITPRVSCISIFAFIIFNKLAKHTYILNKIVKTKATKRQ